MEDVSSESSWNTPFKVKVNFKRQALDATLDTGASFSAVRAELIPETDRNQSMAAWSAPPVRLANNVGCAPLGIIWLPIGFMGKHIYHRFVLIPNLSSPLVLGMDFMKRTCISIHIPTRTVTMDEDPPLWEDLDDDCLDATGLSGGTIMFLDAPPTSLYDKVEESCLLGSEKRELRSLLESFSDLFDGHLGHTSLAEHAIVTGDARPINLPPYRTSPAKKRVIEDQVQKMLQDGIIEPASGPWAAPVVIVNRPDRDPRFCVDYRGLNQQTVKDSYPLPRVDESLDFLARGKYLSTLDLTRGYWQVAVAEESRPKTAFVTHCGLFQFRVLPFGLCNAPATFQRLMNTVLAGLIYKTCAVYLDDIVIASPTFEQHLMDLDEVLSRLRAAGLSLKLAKCQFCLSELSFLGYKVTSLGIHPDADKVAAVTEFKVPTNAKHVRQFLGLTGYYRRFVHNYAQIAEPLFALTKQDTPFAWDSSCQSAFDVLKGCITSAPILRFPDFMRPFFIHTDACDAGLGAALMQRDDEGRDIAVAYASRALHKSEKPYSTPEKECLAVIWALEHFRPYIEGLHVTVFTDHSSLRWLMSRPNPSGRLARWSLRLQDFDFTIVHKPGERNKVPDALSRNPLPTADPPMDLLPEHAVIGGLDLRMLPPVMLADRSHVRQLQLQDPTTGPLLHSLENSDSLDGDCSSQQHVVQDGLLYFHDPKTRCGLHPFKQLKLYVPDSMRGCLLEHYHDHPTAGHLGVTKTLARLRLRFFWPKMASDVKTYVISCSVCQLTKPCQRKPAGLMVPIKPQRPWEYTGVDFVGPLPRTPNGNAYILVFVDYFSKWIEVSAVREATARVAASKFICDVFARHGAPSYLISDRGTPFMSDLFEHAVTSLGTEHRLTTAYHPQTNATERVNRTLKTAIRAYVGDKHTTWDKYIPLLCFALRTAPHESTGFSPSMMLYGRELDTPIDLITQPSCDGVDEPGVSYPENLRASLVEAHDHAREILSESHDRQKRYYDLRRRQVSYEVGDLVRVKCHPRSDALNNFTAKLAPLYSGPLRVSRRLSDVNYGLARVDTGEDAGVYHVVNLQPFHTWATIPSTKRRSCTAADSENPCDLSSDLQYPSPHSSNAAEVDADSTPTDCPLVDISLDADADVPQPTHTPGPELADVTDPTTGSELLTSPDGAPRYNLRPRLAPRVTSGWTSSRWTNPYHCDRLDFN